MDGRTDERTNGMDENYIPLQHTLYARGIIKNIPPLPLPAPRMAGLAQL